MVDGLGFKSIVGLWITFFFNCNFIILFHFMWILMDNLLIFGSVIWWRIVKISVTSGEMEMEMAERITAVLAVFRRRLQPWSSGNPTYRGSPAVIMVYYCIFPFIWFLNLKEIAFHCVLSRLKCIAWLCYLERFCFWYINKFHFTVFYRDFVLCYSH